LETQAGFPDCGKSGLFIFGGDMFDLKNCVNCDGELYCWHSLTNSIVKIKLQSVPVKDCPETVVERLLKAKFDKEKSDG
jgi:hypothetical protein